MTPRVGGKAVPAAPRQLLPKQSSLLLPAPSHPPGPRSCGNSQLCIVCWKHVDAQVCVCVCVCVCVSVWGEHIPEGVCFRSHCIIEARWPALPLRSLGGSGCPLGEKEMAGQRMSIQESLNGPVW